jgi:hypothetical protein
MAEPPHPVHINLVTSDDERDPGPLDAGTERAAIRDYLREAVPNSG